MIIDIHNHLGFSDDGGEAPLEMILENIETYAIDKLVLFAIDEVDSGPTYENSNQKVLNTCKQYPDKLIPFARLMPSEGQKAIEEFARCRKAGVKGLKLKTKDGFAPEDAIPILNMIDQNEKFPIIMHVEHEAVAQPKIWEPIIKDYRHINFIFAHGAKDHYRICGEMLCEHPNLYCDTTTLSYNRTKWLYRKAGSEKIVFGSDFPYSHPGIELKKFEVIIKDKNDLDNILYKNAQKLLDI